MYARNVALHLKPNMLSDFTNTFDSNVLPILRKQKGSRTKITFAILADRCSRDQSVGYERECRSLQHHRLPGSSQEPGQVLDGTPKVRESRMYQFHPARTAPAVAA